MDILPKADWLLRAMGAHVAAGIYEHPLGCLYWRKIPTSDLPNDLVQADDLERFGIAIFDGVAMQDTERMSGKR